MKKVLVFAKDTQRINTLNLLSSRLLFGDARPGYMDTAGLLARQALAMSTDLKYGKGIGNALVNQAFININTGRDFPSTLLSLRKALPLLQHAEDWFSVAGCYGNLGNCYHHIGDNNNAVQAFDSSARLFQQLGDTISSVWQLIPKAHSYFDLGNYEEAYKIFHRAQELAPPTDNMLQCYMGCQLASLFVGANLPEIAIEYMNKIRTIHKSFTPQERINLAWALNWATRVGGEAFLQLNQVDSAVKIAQFLNIPLAEQDAPDNLFFGNLYLALGDSKKALSYFRHGYKLSQNSSYEIGHACHANGLATAYLELKDFSRAEYFAKEAIKVAEKMHATLQQKNAIGTLSKIYAAIKDYPKAYHYNQLYKTMSDSLAPEEYRRKISLIQVRDQLEMQKKESQLLSSQNQLSRQQIKLQESSLKRRSLLIYILIALFLVIGLMAVLVTRNIKLKKRKVQLQQLMEQVNAQQKLTELEKEKTNLEMQALRAQMNPHFIFNCLSSINRFILINKIDEASDYLTKFSRLIRMVLNNSQKTVITLESELDALRLYLDLERLRFKNAFNYSITFINTIDINTVYIPPMLIQPFAENAIWHGLMHKKGIGQLEIQLCAENKTLTCVIIDNGIGRKMSAALNSRSAEKNKSLGVTLTAERLVLLNEPGSKSVAFDIEDLTDDEGEGSGTKVTLSIPYKDLTEVSI